MESQPKFIKEFSKQSPDERQKIAEAIKARRAEEAAEKRARAEAPQDAAVERIAKQEKALKDLERKLEELSTQGLDKIEEEFESNRIRADIALGKKTYEELKQEMENAQFGQQTDKPGAGGAARELLKQFYAEQKEKWANSDYSREDVVKHLSEENLASLSLEDYVTLMRRFPNEMVTHVTRQGVRDHTGMAFHTAGEDQFVDGFKSIAKDGRLRSALGIKVLEGQKEETIVNVLKLNRFKTREEAVAFLHSITRPTEGVGSFADRSTIHFAAEEVADAFYGSEKGNEIFFAYPSAHVASQHYFSGRLDQAGGGQWNDQWVRANEDRGMAIDAGLVFIPEGAKVDPKTGSRYVLDSEMKPMKNLEASEKFKSLVDAPGFKKFADEAIDAVNKRSVGGEKELRKFRSRLKDEFGISDERLQSAVLNYDLLKSLNRSKTRLTEKKGDADEEEKKMKDAIDGALKSEGIYFQEAENAVSSKEYWEKYFAENPDSRPSKIVYYQGQDPTAALHKWRRDNGLEKRSEDSKVSFEDKSVSNMSDKMMAGASRFESLAMQAIDYHFGPEPPPDLDDEPPPDLEDVPPPDDDEPPPLN